MNPITSKAIPSTASAASPITSTTSSSSTAASITATASSTSAENSAALALQALSALSAVKFDPNTLKPLFKFLAECDPALTPGILRRSLTVSGICDLCFIALVNKIGEHNPLMTRYALCQIINIDLRFTNASRQRDLRNFLEACQLPEDLRTKFNEIYLQICSVEQLASKTHVEWLNGNQKTSQNSRHLNEFFDKLLLKLIVLFRQGIENCWTNITLNAKRNNEFFTNQDSCSQLPGLLQVFALRTYKLIDQLKTSSLQASTLHEVVTIVETLGNELRNYEVKTSFLYAVPPRSIMAQNAVCQAFIDVHGEYNKFYKMLAFFISQGQFLSIPKTKISKHSQQEFFDLVSHAILETKPKTFPSPQDFSRQFFEFCNEALRKYLDETEALANRIYGQSVGGKKFFRQNLERSFRKIKISFTETTTVKSLFHKLHEIFKHQSSLFVDAASKDEVLAPKWQQQQFAARNVKRELQTAGKGLLKEIQPIISGLTYIGFCSSMLYKLIKPIENLGKKHTKTQSVSASSPQSAILLPDASPSMSTSKAVDKFFQVLQTYNKDFAKESSGILSFLGWKLTAKDALLVLPVKSNLKQAQEAFYAFREMMHGKYISMKSVPNEEDFITEYCDYLKNCKVSESDQRIYKKLATIIFQTPNTADLPPGGQINNEQAEGILLAILGLVKDLCMLYKPLLDEAKQEVEAAITAESKLEKSATGPQNSKLLSLLNSLKLYTHNRIPHLNFIFANSEMSWLKKASLAPIVNFHGDLKNDHFKYIINSLREEIKNKQLDRLVFAINTVDKFYYQIAYQLSQSFNIFSQLKPKEMKLTQKLSTRPMAHENIHLLETEQEMLVREALAKATISEATPKEEASATSIPSTQNAAAAKSPSSAMLKRVASPLNTALSDVLFDFQKELVQFHQLHTGLLVSKASATNISVSKVAVFEQLYANDCFTMALEMFSHSKCLDEQILLIDLILEFGHRGIEQSMRAEYLLNGIEQIGSALKYSAQNLNRCASYLNKTFENEWFLNAHDVPFYSRYPMYYQAHGTNAIPLGLEHAQCASKYTVIVFTKNLMSWIYDALSSQMASLSQNANDEKLSKLRSLAESICKLNFDVVGPAQVNSARNKIHRDLIESDRKLEASINKLGPHALLSPSRANALKHLKRFRIALKLLSSFPQQRYKHVILHSLISTVKYFTENFGVAFAFKKGEACLTQSLSAYVAQYGLGNNLSDTQKDTLKMIDVGTGNEYPCRYFACTPQTEMHSLMQLKSKYHEIATEAWLKGENAVQSESNVKESDAELIDLAKRFANLAAALVQ